MPPSIQITLYYSNHIFRSVLARILNKISTSRSSIVINLFIFGPRSLSFSLRPGHEELLVLVSDMHGGQLRLCDSADCGHPGFSAPPGENTCCASSLCYLIQQRVFCRRHTCSLVQETSMWTEQGITQCRDMMVCAFPCVCRVLNMFVWSQ